MHTLALLRGQYTTRNVQLQGLGEGTVSLVRSSSFVEKYVLSDAEGTGVPLDKLEVRNTNRS